MILVQGITVRVGSFTLSDVSLSLAQGQYGVVIGPAGSGKTTLLEAIAGVTQIASGQIVVADRDVTHAQVNDRALGLVYQHAYLFPHLTVAENIAYASTDAATLAELVEAFGIGELLARGVTTLSGGERQLVALVRALAPRPPVLLLDEPFSALDPRRRVVTRRAVRDLHRRWGLTTLQVTHDFAEAGLLGDVVVVLQAGRVLQAGPPVEVFGRPASPEIAAFLGVENVLSGDAAFEVDDAADGGTSAAAGLRPMTFRSGALVIHAMGDVASGPSHAVIRAEEVVISREARASSARNHFGGVVTEVAHQVGAARVMVDCSGVPLVALLTSSSVRELQLSQGQSVYVSFKAFAVHLC